MDPKTASETETDICAEWEIKTITSALKTYLRMLPGPLMMYQFQRSFIKAAKLENQESRVSEIHSLVHRLPEKNRQMLQLLMNHLANVANNHKQNLMTVANLGVVFGPTLLRPQEETVAAIMDIKFQNIVIEILIENHEKIFNTVPDMPLTNAQLHLSRKKSSDSKPPSCSERPLTLFHTIQSTEKQEQRNSIINSSLESVSSNPNSIINSSSSLQPNMNSSDPDLAVVKPTRPNSLPPNPSPTSPLSPSWPMFSAPSSPMPTSSTSSDSSPIRSVAGFVWFSVAAVVLSLAWSSLHAVFSLLVNFVPCHPNLHLLFDRPEEAVHEDSRHLHIYHFILSSCENEKRNGLNPIVEKENQSTGR
uniref:Rho-GTPase-activating protein 26 n=1 Tax=Pan troglodytes TaxID=9598 RepID=G2HEI9_PANTR|nr:Rho-GTPase-activating protein 26 [Pan troglodytes]